MTAADIAGEAEGQNGLMRTLLGVVALTIPAAAPRFPTAVANHPAFTRRFNARLVAVGMAATNGHRRLVAR